MLYQRSLDGKGYFITKKQLNGSGRLIDYLMIAEFPRSVNGNRDSKLLLKALQNRRSV